MSVILAIETATETCSAAVVTGEKRCAQYEYAQRVQTEKVLPMVQEVLDEAGITLAQTDAIAFGAGPGAFTGLRVATAVTQGLAFAANKPVIPVSTLATLALHPKAPNGVILSCFDARMGQVYLAVYRKNGNGLEELYTPSLLSPEQLPEDCLSLLKGGGVHAIGNGMQYLDAFVSQGAEFDEVLSDLFPRAEDMLLIAERLYLEGKSAPADKVEPLYLRDKVAWKTKEQQAKT